MPQLSRLLGRSMANVSVPSASPSRRIALDSFAFRQFDDPNYGGTRIEYASKQAFEDEVNSYYDERFRLEEVRRQASLGAAVRTQESDAHDAVHGNGYQMRTKCEAKTTSLSLNRSNVTVGW